MHLLQTTASSLDDSVEPLDLCQTPGDIVVLSFADSDLAGLAAAYAAEKHLLPSVRLAHLRDLRHPMSIDLWSDKVCPPCQGDRGEAARRSRLVALRRRSAFGAGARAEHRACRAAGGGPRRSAPRGGFDLASARACGTARLFPRRWAREFIRSAAATCSPCRVSARHAEATDRAALRRLSARPGRGEPRCARRRACAAPPGRADPVLPLGAARGRRHADRCAVRGARCPWACAGAAGDPEPQRY